MAARNICNLRFVSRMLACGRLICCLAAAGLTAAYPSANGQGPNAVGDFSIPDVNPNSASFDTNVSPRDYLQQVSGWYFGHAT